VINGFTSSAFHSTLSLKIFLVPALSSVFNCCCVACLLNALPVNFELFVFLDEEARLLLTIHYSLFTIHHSHFTIPYLTHPKYIVIGIRANKRQTIIENAQPVPFSITRYLLFETPSVLKEL